MELSTLAFNCAEEKKVLLTTNFLLNIDSHAFEGKFRYRSYPLLDMLQEIYDYFYLCRQKNYFVLFSHETRKILSKNSFHKLQVCIQALVPLLKVSALKYLESYLQDQTIGLPIYEVWE